jgi:chorismate mutase
MDDLKQLRNQIDSIDQTLMELLDKRFDLSVRVGKVKKQTKTIVEHINREQEILKKTHDKTHIQSIQSVYESIFRESKALQ